MHADAPLICKSLVTHSCISSKKSITVADKLHSMDGRIIVI
jgi:hypothetical protein